MNEEVNEEGKIILPKALQAEMMSFFLEVAVRQKKREQLEQLLSENNDRSKE